MRWLSRCGLQRTDSRRVFLVKQAGVKRAAFFLGLGLCFMAVAASGSDSPAGDSPVANSKRSAPVWVAPKKVLKRRFKDPLPKYPVMARINFIQGKVLLNVVIDEDGNVEKTHVLKGHPFLALAALQSVRNWRFKPFITNGQRTPIRTTIAVPFVLRRRNFRAPFLPPHRAARDLEQRISPPEILTSKKELGNGNTSGERDSVRLRVLLSETGMVEDARIVSGDAGLLPGAVACAMRMRFKPAYFGTIPVPWYFELEVPLDEILEKEDDEMEKMSSAVRLPNRTGSDVH